MTRVGVVIPTRDGGERFGACLEALRRQDPPAEAVVIIDSGSTDGTPERARKHAGHLRGLTVQSITPQTFDHGITRNQAAAALPPVDVIVFLVQDAVPLDDDFLGVLGAACHQPGVGAATARQVPPEGADFLTQATVSESPFAEDERVVTGPFPSTRIAALSPRDWRALLRLDDVAAAVRGDVFRRSGYRQTSHGEDALMAYDLLCAGWSLVHEPDAVVEHGHAYDPEGAHERYRADARFFRERFGYRVRPSRLSAWKGLYHEFTRDLRWLMTYPEDRVPGAWGKSWALRRAQVVGQWRGSRGPLGRLPERREMPRPEELDRVAFGGRRAGREAAS